MKSTTSKRLVLLALTLCLGACSRRQGKVMNESINLSKNEIKTISSSVLQGDLSSQYCELVNYYALARGDLKQANYWEERAAENGVGAAQYLVASNLIDTTNEENVLRAIFWLKTAETNGDANAKPRIDDLLNNNPNRAHTIEVANSWSLPSESIILSNDAEMQKAKLSALLGNKVSATGVALHCLYQSGKGEQFEKWITIAAQNGSPYGQRMLAQYLLSKNNQDEQLRGKFWLLRSQKQNAN